MQRSRLRASDADREAVADRLRNAAADGRLLAHEFEERVARALRARTYGELDAVVADLPRAPAPRARVSMFRPALVVAIAIAVVAVVAVAALVITGLLTAWAVWALVAWWAFGGRCAHRRRRMLRGGSWHVTRVSGHADRRAWL